MEEQNTIKLAKPELINTYISTLSNLYEFCKGVYNEIAEYFLDLQLASSSMKGCGLSVIEGQVSDMKIYLRQEASKFKSVIMCIKEDVLTQVQVRNKEFLATALKLAKVRYDSREDDEWAAKLVGHMKEQINFYFNGLYSIVKFVDPLLYFHVKIISILSDDDSNKIKTSADLEAWFHKLSKDLNDGIKMVREQSENLKQSEALIKNKKK